MEEQNTIVTLIDEQGKEVEFDLVATFDYEKIKFYSHLLLEKVLWNLKGPYRLIMIITCHCHHSVQPPLTLVLNTKS